MDVTVLQLVMAFGIPSAITGLGVFFLKKHIEKNDAKHKEKESNLEALVLMMMQSTRANSVGIEAIARAIQRIPDAHCNGDMEEALEKMNIVQKEEKEFLLNKGIKYIFE